METCPGSQILYQMSGMGKGGTMPTWLNRVLWLAAGYAIGSVGGFIPAAHHLAHFLNSL